MDQADLIATALEPFVEGVPVDTRGFHGDQEPLTPGFAQMRLKGLFKALETLPGMGQFEFTTAHGGLRPHARIVFGFAHIDSNEEEVRVVYIFFTLIGGSSILLQSHETYLLLR